MLSTISKARKLVITEFCSVGNRIVFSRLESILSPGSGGHFSGTSAFSVLYEVSNNLISALELLRYHTRNLQELHANATQTTPILCLLHAFRFSDICSKKRKGEKNDNMAFQIPWGWCKFSPLGCTVRGFGPFPASSGGRWTGSCPEISAHLVRRSQPPVKRGHSSAPSLRTVYRATGAYIHHQNLSTYMGLSDLLDICWGVLRFHRKLSPTVFKSS